MREIQILGVKPKKFQAQGKIKSTNEKIVDELDYSIDEIITSNYH